MKMTIEPSELFAVCGDVTVRLWRGTTEGGAVITALVAGVIGHGNVDEIAASLMSIPPPTPADAQRWARHVLEEAERPG